MLWRSCDETQGRQSVTAFCHGALYGAPARGQRVDDRRSAHDDARLRPGAGGAAYDAGAPCAVRGLTGPTRLRDRGQSCVAVLHARFGGVLGRQGGVEHVAASECGGVGLRVLVERQGEGARLDGQRDPVSEAPLCGLGHELLQSPLGVGARLVRKGRVLRGDLGLERGPCGGPRVPPCLGPHRMPPPPRAAARSREPRGHLLSAQVHVPDPGAPQLFHRGCREGGKGMAPRRGAGCDLLALAHAPGAHQRARGDAASGLARRQLRRPGVRSGGMPRTHVERDRMPGLIAESGDDNLQCALVAIAVVTTGCEVVVWACQGATGHRRQTEVDGCGLAALRTEPLRARGVDPRQPIHVLVQRLRITGVEAQDITGGRRHRETHGREARALGNAARAPVPQGQFACTGRAQGRCKPHASGDGIPRPHRTKSPAVLQRDGVLAGPQGLQRLRVPQSKSHGRALCLGTLTALRHGTLEDLAVGARRLAPQMPRIGCAPTSATRGLDLPSGYYSSICIKMNQG